MKHIPILYIIIVGSLLHLLGGCSWTDSYPDTLLQAEQLMKVYQPDSALALLTRYKDTAMRGDMRTRMYHHLLTTKALDKCHIPHTSDSLMYEVVKYYETEGPANLLTEGYYLLGSVYEDMGIPTKALENYLKTWERIEGQDEYQFKGLVCSRIGTLYMFQALYDEALPFFRKAFQYDQLAGDSIGLVYDLRDLGRYYEVKKQKDSTLIYFNKARNMAQIIQEAKLEKIVAQEMAHTYLSCKDTNTVRLILEQVKNIESDNNPAFTYKLWADFYKVINKEDSMTYFYQKSLEVGNVHVKTESSRRVIFNRK